MAPHSATFESVAFGYLGIPEEEKKKAKRHMLVYYSRIISCIQA